jgi:hypothetical protein
MMRTGLDTTAANGMEAAGTDAGFFERLLFGAGLAAEAFAGAAAVWDENELAGSFTPSEPVRVAPVNLQ